MRLGYILVVLFCSLSVGCFFSSTHNKALSDRCLDAAKLDAAESFSVRPPNFASVEKPESYITKDQLLEEMREEIPEFNEELQFQARKAGLEGQVQAVGANEAVSSGVVVETKVVSIKLGWDFYDGGEDRMTVDLRFSDAADGTLLYEARVDLSSTWYSPQPSKTNESKGRLGMATWNLVRPILMVIRQGKISAKSW